MIPVRSQDIDVAECLSNVHDFIISSASLSDENSSPCEPFGGNYESFFPKEFTLISHGIIRLLLHLAKAVTISDLKQDVNLQLC